jgi:hypothetical protein
MRRRVGVNSPWMTARRLRALPGCTWSPGWRCCGPGEQVFTAMLDGWGSQQLARKLAVATVAGRQRVVRAYRQPRRGVPVGVDAADGR